jgi:hypothetical protein
MRRRRTDTFGLSFLDCICCGFGAVILFYVMMSAQGGLRGLHTTDALKSEISRLQIEVDSGSRNLAQLKNALAATQSELAEAAGSASRLTSEITQQQLQLSTYDASSLARRAHVEELRTDNHALEEGAHRLEAGSAERAPLGQDVRSFATGDVRRYLTGLALHGKHILILVDRSASMLHEDVVSVIRLRNADDATKRNAAKWRRTVAIVDWLGASLPAGSRYQIYAFNTRPEPLVPGTAGTWLDSADPTALARGLQELRTLVPRDGTSLINAFAAARTLNPVPDQIVLITDGLPTQGRTAPVRKYIDAGAREHLFDEAVTALPRDVPTDTVLLPMQGEVQGAHRFWALARLTHGTLVAPSKDWP